MPNEINFDAAADMQERIKWARRDLQSAANRPDCPPQHAREGYWVTLDKVRKGDLFRVAFDAAFFPHIEHFALADAKVWKDKSVSVLELTVNDEGIVLIDTRFIENRHWPVIITRLAADYPDLEKMADSIVENPAFKNGIQEATAFERAVTFVDLLAEMGRYKR